MTDEDDLESPRKPIPSYFHEGIEVFACPCGSLSIAYRPHEYAFCAFCMKRGPDATTKEGALAAWNRYAMSAYWRSRHVQVRTQAKPSP